MRKLSRILLLFCFCSCQGASEKTTIANNYKVQRLFTVDGCTVYRFCDSGSVYFTNCKGTTSWRVDHGRYTEDKSVSGGGG